LCKTVDHHGETDELERVEETHHHTQFEIQKGRESFLSDHPKETAECRCGQMKEN